MIVPIVFLFILFTEMRNMQSAAREHTQRVFHETEKLRKQLAEKESSIERRSKELNEQVAQTDMERRKLEEERKRCIPISISATFYCPYLLYHCITYQIVSELYSLSCQ